VRVYLLEWDLCVCACVRVCVCACVLLVVFLRFLIAQQQQRRRRRRRKQRAIAKSRQSDASLAVADARLAAAGHSTHPEFFTGTDERASEQAGTAQSAPREHQRANTHTMRGRRLGQRVRKAAALRPRRSNLVANSTAVHAIASTAIALHRAANVGIEFFRRPYAGGWRLRTFRRLSPSLSLSRSLIRYFILFLGERNTSPSLFLSFAANEPPPRMTPNWPDTCSQVYFNIFERIPLCLALLL
jgi:hypothetical protein